MIIMVQKYRRVECLLLLCSAIRLAMKQHAISKMIYWWHLAFRDTRYHGRWSTQFQFYLQLKELS